MSDPLSGLRPLLRRSGPGGSDQCLVAQIRRDLRSGFVRTQRRGDTGIGYTLGSLLGLAESNDPGTNFRRIEIKAWRIDQTHSAQRKPMNLFLKEPHWFDRGTRVERIKRFGYLDGSQRPAWYQTVTTRENLPGLRLQTDDRATTLLLLHHADAIGQWHYAHPSGRTTTEECSDLWRFRKAGPQGSTGPQTFRV